jgi:hypothetical protein
VLPHHHPDAMKPALRVTIAMPRNPCCRITIAMP